MGKIYDIIIIGGGAAGLYAAATLSSFKWEKFPDILLLEKMERCGRKIGITGKGRCNVTNTKPWGEFSTHIHPKNVFLKNAFYGMDNLATMAFFESLGLPLVVERGDRVYPQSMHAADVTAALEHQIVAHGVGLCRSCSVLSIRKEAECFALECSDGMVRKSARVIIATGGLSYPTTGSTGDGYGFARAMGHKVTSCFPSLTALTPKGYREEYAGISLKNVALQLVVNGDVVQDEFGDMDFTNGGIEGPIGFKISRKGVHSVLNGQKVEVRLDLKPAVELHQLQARVEREAAAAGRNVLRTVLHKLLPMKLVPLFLAAHKDLTLDNLAGKLKCWVFPIEKYVGYERCVVTAGGVSLAEVSQKTMESKLVKGLYFAGELLDLDGDTGGYNLQIAFSTAALAAVSIAREMGKE